MIVDDLMAEIGEKLGTIAGLRVTPYAADSVNPPAAVVLLPDDITFDATYGRGSDEMEIPVLVLISKANDRNSHTKLAAYLDGSGAKSIKAAVDSTNANPYTAADTVTVMTATIGAFTFAAVDLLGAEFTVHVSGSGS